MFFNYFIFSGCGLPFFGKPFTASNIHGITGLEGIFFAIANLNPHLFVSHLIKRINFI